MIVDFINAHHFVFAFLFGLIPALVWLWFWLREDVHHEPSKMITLSFIGGMVAVVFVLPLQQLVYDHIQEQNALAFTLWAALEELFKLGFVYVIALRNKKTADEPIDDVIYLLISALGFVAAENTLFLLGPLQTGDFVGTIVNGNLRFIGASLLHVISSGTIGVFMALAYYKSAFRKKIYLLAGIILAIALHTTFNLFIINKSGGNIFLIFGAVWIGIIALLLLFEKVKSIKK